MLEIQTIISVYELDLRLALCNETREKETNI